MNNTFDHECTCMAWALHGFAQKYEKVNGLILKCQQIAIIHWFNSKLGLVIVKGQRGHTMFYNSFT